MTRRAFYSFHYVPDCTRASQVRNMGVVEGNPPARDNDWESVVRGGDKAIRRWIDDQMYGRSCVVVLIGAETAGRKWINYEIQKGWSDRKGLLGIHIHGLKDLSGATSWRGADPFSDFEVDGTSLSSIVPVYDPTGWDSKATYGTIKENMADWIEEAIAVRSEY